MAVLADPLLPLFGIPIECLTDTAKKGKEIFLMMYLGSLIYMMIIPSDYIMAMMIDDNDDDYDSRLLH